MKLTRKQRAAAIHFASLTDAQLTAWFETLGTQRVKRGRNKGHVTITAARLGDTILDELKRRREMWAGTGCEEA